MKTMTASISAGTVLTLMLSMALWPLPDFAGGTTGVKLAYNIMSAGHIDDVTDWVLALDENAHLYDNNGEEINAIQMDYFIHGGGKPKKYEYKDVEQYYEEIEEWREEKRDIKKEVLRLKGVRGGLTQSRLSIAKNSPIKQHWQH